MASAAVLNALDSLRKGKFVLVYDADGREEETDMIIASEHITPDAVRTMRKDGGGLICTTADASIQDALGLPFMAEVFEDLGQKYPVMNGLAPNDIPYDVKSAFGITINHRDTFTGITDKDRALTIAKFSDLAKRAVATGDGWGVKEFGKGFRAPGHVHLLNASRGILENRYGHTELSTALMIMAGLVPSATVCEMMGDDGNALSKDKASEYAERNGIGFLEGADIISAWKDFCKG
ncbi:MAG: 3,4-dihydroxy-2-butanone-4-phosphate synthase [Methanobacteriota archaeon]|nr:MAG: 3,4-dihydroxy-2-butanone-4-phosphate synthase [Euryarchaeota archaeon]